ncbi:MAG: tannase/feruloyl esterase family alpha/beta hydrolase [Rhodospirillaceae bacterium]|nr:tannase/feruloyl esterase family alpha/beta hydrolase [Rhodospirillaceae bacterium]
MTKPLVALFLVLSSSAFAQDPGGSPWVAIDDAVCAGLKIQDFAADVGAPVMVHLSERVPESTNLPAYCRVTATIAPKNSVEIRMPISGWQGRLLMAGCGGLCGSIQMARTDDALARRYAVAHTDMGHAEEDMSFADDPALLRDFAHRATHVATKLLKATARVYYSRAHDYAYFRGCSTGGRQGLTAALMYPEDYDGIIAGAPASGPAVPNIVWALKANTRADGSSILDAPAIATLHRAVLGACDMDDGVKDGIVGDPENCTFDPASIVCGNAAKGRCLTPEQAAAAKAIYGGVVSVGGKKFASRGFLPGGELGWLRGLVRTDKPAGFEGIARNYLRRFTEPNGPKTLAELDFAKHVVHLTPVDALPDFGSEGKRLAMFESSGGKLLLYHSWADDSLTTATAVDVYAAHEKAFGRDNLDPFFRLFVIPGMFHCRGGEGPDAVDFLSAMESWVEKGKAPDRLIAYKPHERPPMNSEYRFPLPRDQIVFSRPVFAYPATAKYTGSGDVNDASNWVKK